MRTGSIGSVALAGLAITLWCRPAYAYIDPGITVLLAQGLFTFIFGTIAAWILAPWRFIKRLFGFGKDAQPDKPQEPEVSDDLDNR